MELIHVDEIIVPKDRIRKEFDVDELRKLRESILEIGLIHPVLLRPDRHTIVAGERRLRILRDLFFDKKRVTFDANELPLGMVPYVAMGTPDEITYLEAEFAENARRAQLTWQEEAEYTLRYKILRGERTTNQELAESLGTHRRVVSQSLILANFLHDPTITKERTRDAALKSLEIKLEKGHREAVSKQVGPTTRTDLHTLTHGDLRVELPKLAPGQFDAIIADPPYGVDANRWDNMSAPAHLYKDDEALSDELYATIASEGLRTAKPDAVAYLFCEQRRFEKVRSILSAAGWRVWSWPFIYWRGPTNGVVPWPDGGPRRTYECIAFAIKGNRRTLGVFPDVLLHPDAEGAARGAGKPASLYTDLLQRSCLPGNTILDPCVGTGSIFDAATRARVRCVGIEIEAAAYAQARERLK